VIGKPRIRKKPPGRPGPRHGRSLKQDEAQALPTRERIVAVAERLFEERGFQATNLSDIADEAEIRSPSLLYYFGSKERLLDEVIRRMHVEIREKVVLALASGGSGTERINGVIREVRQLWEGRPGLVRLALAEALRPNGVGRNYLAQAAGLIELIENVFRNGTDPPIPALAPARGALLMIFSSELFRLAFGEIGDLLWGADVDRTDEVHTALLNALRAKATMT
jgi:AcrR family transcriptional regulator